MTERWASYIHIKNSPNVRVGQDGSFSRSLAYTLRLLHPFMPFVTEEIWQPLPHAGDALLVAPWPEAEEPNGEAEQEMELLMDIIRGIRNARAEYNVAAGGHTDLLTAQKPLLVALARVNPKKLTIEAIQRLVQADALISFAPDRLAMLVEWVRRTPAYSLSFDSLEGAVPLVRQSLGT